MREARSKAVADWIEHQHEHNRKRLRLAGKRADHGRGLTEDRVGSQIDQLFCQRPEPTRITSAPPKFDPEIAALGPPQFRKRASERCEVRLRSGIAGRIAHQDADQPYGVGGLRVGGKRPSDCRTTSKRYEFAPPHCLPFSSGRAMVGVKLSHWKWPTHRPMERPADVRFGSLAAATVST